MIEGSVVGIEDGRGTRRVGGDGGLVDGRGAWDGDGDGGGNGGGNGGML